jgi:hypothetical protein
VVTLQCGFEFSGTAFFNAFDAGSRCCAFALLSLASWAANKALNLSRASSLEFNFSSSSKSRSFRLNSSENRAEWGSTRPDTVWWDATRGGASYKSAARFLYAIRVRDAVQY